MSLHAPFLLLLLAAMSSPSPASELEVPPHLQHATKVFSIFDIDVYMSHFMVILLVFATVSSSDWSASSVIFRIIVYGPLLFGTVLVHELGHALACRRQGGVCHHILLWPLGGLAYISHDAGPKADLWVAFAGPLTHVPMCLLWFFMLLISTGGNASLFPVTNSYLVIFFATATSINLALMIFNLLVPAHPLDGGRILVDILLWAKLPLRQTAIITVCVSVPLALVMCLHWTFMPFSVITIFVGLWIIFNDVTVITALRDGVIDCHPMFAHLSPSDRATMQNNPVGGV